MNTYERKQEDKRERLRAAAEKRRSASQTLYSAGQQALEAIPFGQPIHVGHHSERSDRAYRARAVGKIDRSFQLSAEAEKLEARADSVGTGGISSDDPQAIDKLRTKLDGLREIHAAMVSANKEARAKDQPAPYVACQLTNSNANIRRITQRLERLAKAAITPEADPITGNGWTIREDRDENRILIAFEQRQPEDTVRLIRSRGFIWSPSRTAWVRKLTRNATRAARQLADILPGTPKVEPNQPTPTV
ncbi:MAG TPA: DUF3560 domain-containing protein [Thermoanaerobaculia bacterium]|jgi:hypothetical protein|nr:DUF3560 domain-containing protein [Thermoanaerobaculia bacterium]